MFVRFFPSGSRWKVSAPKIATTRMVERRGGESLNKEASWRACLVECRRGKFKSTSNMETIVWWSAGEGKVSIKKGKCQ